MSYLCRACHSTFEEWVGRCPDCGTWSSFEVDLRGCEILK
ncbi:MAG: hypothetical protein ACP5KH_07485 [Thermodesulfovibrio sp.]